MTALQDAMIERGSSDTEPVGETYGANASHYIEAEIPTVVFGSGRIEEAHFPDESISWPDVVTAAEVLAETARRFLRS
ncbi:M20/M25/M40 family metallo-hydrolase [Natronoglomus mannanivorans]|uniref:M20/M25/M40 family metallo-hydrolase n=1 Tax=Natronoglomus mannanivorans TaxID=2979990 RepID=A0AAP2YXH2_9EURY|nr:M20/M25/M40 family metallo-hydrolase [Halobacteria archaeon AArc-xg1-1]